MRELGEAQAYVLGALLDALEAAEPPRRELASFLVHAAYKLLFGSWEPRECGPLRAPPPWQAWIRELDTRGPLSARQRGFQAAATFLRALGRLDGW